MLFQNLNVNRLIVHEVFRRTDDRQKVQPTYGAQLVTLPSEAKSAFHDRVIAALGSQSQCMHMTISNANAESCYELCRTAINSNDTTFVAHSRKFADLLADAQTSRQIPGGILVVFDGSVGHPACRIVGVIKAEPHTGFMRHMTNGAMALQYLKDLILTPQTKLYKLGLFIEVDATAQQLHGQPNGWSAYVYDNVIATSNKNSAAQYFYEVFLGCAFPQNSALQTKTFYELTKTFIRQLNLPEEDKIDLLTGLYSYLKVDQTPTIEVATFANSFLPSANVRDGYQAYMSNKDFPLTAIPKDISDLKHALKQRRITFGNDIRLTAPPERFNDKIEIEEILQPSVSSAIHQTWTRITIKDRISTQE